MIYLSTGGGHETDLVGAIMQGLAPDGRLYIPDALPRFEPAAIEGDSIPEIAATLLAEHFPFEGDMAPYAYRFNPAICDRYHEVLDFINMHYCLTRRTDTDFWREVTKPERVTDRLAAYSLIHFAGRSRYASTEAVVQKTNKKLVSST